jgi:origin recognition complex subunit 5
VRHDLPYYSKFLLISAFLASYNPTKDDARIFARDSGMKRKVRRAGHKSNKGIAKVISKSPSPLLTADVTTINWAAGL